VAVYAVGDVQGCWRELEALLLKVQFKDSDELWLAGDLINRGPDSLRVLRELRDFRAQTRIVLGNHDLHFLAIVFGGHSAGAKDTFGELLAADDVEELAHWLRRQKLLHTDFGYTMVHAGLPPQWNLKHAQSYAQEVEAVIGQSDVRQQTIALGSGIKWHGAIALHRQLSHAYEAAVPRWFLGLCAQGSGARLAAGTITLVCQ